MSANPVGAVGLPRRVHRLFFSQSLSTHSPFDEILPFCAVQFTFGRNNWQMACVRLSYPKSTYVLQHLASSKYIRMLTRDIGSLVDLAHQVPSCCAIPADHTHMPKALLPLVEGAARPARYPVSINKLNKPRLNITTYICYYEINLGIPSLVRIEEIISSSTILSRSSSRSVPVWQ